MNPTRRQKKPPRRILGKINRRGKGRCEACHKVSFPHSDAAYSAALRLSRHVGPVRVYPCPHGHGWHLTRRYEWA